jgi:opacity protein-like surface antigen
MKKILLLLVSVICIQMAQAQKGYGAVTYSMAVPMGDMSNYIDQISYRGTNIEFYWHLKKNIDVGAEVGWNVFYAREDKATYTHETEAITGIQYRYINAVPMLASVRWRKPGGDLQPYVGAGVGTSSMNRSTDFGLYRIINNTWQFCLRPEAGLIYKLSEATSATAGVKYYANFENDEQDAQTFLTVNVGFVFGLSQW